MLGYETARKELFILWWLFDRGHRMLLVDIFVLMTTSSRSYSTLRPRPCEGEMVGTQLGPAVQDARCLTSVLMPSTLILRDG